MIPISMIRQYMFCPRIVYFSMLTNIKPKYPRHISLGNEYHKEQDNLLKDRRFKKLNIKYNQILSNQYLENEQYNICGYIDLAFICDGEIIPIEYKFSDNKKPSYSHILQLYGYGLLLQDKYNKKFEKAFIIYSKNIKFFKITINNKIKNDFLKTIKNIDNILEKQIFPNSSANENKCLQCEYLNYCDDRF